LEGTPETLKLSNRQPLSDESRCRGAIYGLFIGDAQAGERSAIIYTIIESCRRRDLDPYAYLKDVLTRLPHMTNWQVSEVTPEVWGKSRKTLQRQAASLTS